MTTAHMTVDDAAAQLLPHLSPELVKLWRGLTKQVGFRNLGKAMCYLKPEAKVVEAVIIDEGRPRRASQPRPRNSWDYRPMTMARALKMPPTVYTAAVVAAIRQWHAEHPYNPALWPFCGSMAKGASYAVDMTDAKLAKYEAKECCGAPMGIMESWDGTISAVYQCAVNPKHTKPALSKQATALQKANAKVKRMSHVHTRAAYNKEMAALAAS